MPYVTEHTPKVSTRSVKPYACESSREKRQQDRQTARQTDRQTETQTDCPKPLFSTFWGLYIPNPVLSRSRFFARCQYFHWHGSNSNFNPLFGLSSPTPFWNHPLWRSEHAWNFWAYPIYHSSWSLQLIDTLTLPALGRTAVKPPLASILQKGVFWYFFVSIGSDSQISCFRKACLAISLLCLHFLPHLGR